MSKLVRLSKHIVLLNYLEKRKTPASTWEISKATNDCAVHTTVADLRSYFSRNDINLNVICDFVCIKNERRVYKYRLVTL